MVLERGINLPDISSGLKDLGLISAHSISGQFNCAVEDIFKCQFKDT
jgi:hypothetical protein